MHDPMHWPSFLCGMLTGVSSMALFMRFLQWLDEW